MIRNKKETGRVAGILQVVALMLIGGLIGGTGSAIFILNRNGFRDILKYLNAGIKNYAPQLMIFFCICYCAAGVFFVIRAGRMFRRWDGEEEAWAEEMEKRFYRWTTILSFMMVIGVVLSGLIVAEIPEHISVESVASVLFFVFSLLWAMVCMEGIMKYTKKVAPEKRGNVLSWNFNKQWLESCDEREKKKLYCAAYHTNVAMQVIYGVAYVILILLSGVMKVGVLPFILLGIIWSSQILINLYQYEHRS